MKKLYFLFLTLLISACFSGLKAQEYDPSDVAVLKAIRDNAPSISPLKTEWADDSNPGSWPNINWTETAPKKVKNLILISKNLTTVVVSSLSSLEHFNCSNNQLTLLNIAGMNNLKEVFCMNNALTSINVTGSVNLQRIDCSSNLIVSLDFSGLSNIYDLRCHYNRLNYLNINGLTALQILYCYSNQLTSLNVSGLTNLQNLYCYSNQLNSLDASGLINLRNLYCYSNQIVSLNVSGCTMLEYIDCAPNSLTSLNVSGLTNLRYLYCYSNQLNALNVSGCTNLYYLNCYANKLSSLDVSGLSSLQYLYLYNNYFPFSKLPLRNPSLYSYSYSPQYKIFEEKSITTGVEISYASEAVINGTVTSFTWFKNDQPLAFNTSAITPTEPGYYFCQMTNAQFPGLMLTTNTVTVGTPTVPEFNPDDVAWLKTIRDNAPAGSPLKTEWADAVPVKLWPNITWTDTYPKQVSTLTLNNKGLLSLDVTGLAKLNNLSCSSNQITSLKISGLSGLSTVNCTGNQLSSLNLSALPLLQNLNISSNKFTSFDARSLTNLFYLYCNNNQLTSLNVSGLTGLYYLSCYGNQLTSLKVTELTGLYYLYCYSNKLTSLDVTGLSNLRYLYCYYNYITSLDVSGLSYLYYLYCYNNNMQSLKVSGLSSLRYLYCYNNNLSTLNLTGLTNLYYLQCQNNKLTALNVNGLSNLRYLYFDTNKIPFSAMPLPNPVYYSYDNNPQNKLFEERVVCPGTVLDYSSEALIDGSATTFNWYKNGVLITGTDQSGKYTATGDGDYFCTMTNPKFPGLTLTTNTVTVDDNVPPVMTLHETCVYLTNEGQWTLNALNKLAISKDITDNCTAFKDLIITFSPMSFDCADAGKKNQVTVTATDRYNNTSSAITLVTVLDTIKPEAKCQDVTTTLDEFGQAYIFQAQVNASKVTGAPVWAKFFENETGGSYDNCGIDSLFLSRQLFTCADLAAPVEVTLSAVDISGNMGTCKAKVTVLDTMVPVITQQANIEMTVAPGVCTTKVTYPEIKATDNCPVTLDKIAGLGANGDFPVGTSTETWQATDGGGKFANMTFTVTINTYNAAPAIATIADVTKDEDTPAFDIPLLGIGYGIDCIPQQIASLDVVNNNTALLTVTKNYTLGAATGSLTITPLANKYGEATITLTVKDNGGTANGGVDTTVKTFKITINPVNDVPTVTPIADQVVILPKTLSVNVVTPFKDVDDGDVLTFKLTKADGSALPTWMSFSATTGLLTGTPTLANYGAVDIKVVATDKAGATAEDVFNVLVKGEFKISGKVVRKTGTPDLITQGKDPVATPAAGVEVVLKQGDVVVVSTTTAADGTYSFAIPAGDYGVFIIVPGYTQEVTQNVTVNTANPVKDKVDFTIWTGINYFVITKINDLNTDFGIKFYPNPTTGIFNIDLSGNDIRKVNLSVSNILGTQVFRNQYFGGNKITIDLSGHAAGIYLIKIEAEGQTVVRKITLDPKK